MQNPELKQYLDGVLSLLDTTPADKTLLTRILSSEAAIDRAGLVAKISDGGLRGRLTTLLPEIEQAALCRPPATRRSGGGQRSRRRRRQSGVDASRSAMAVPGDG